MAIKLRKRGRPSQCRPRIDKGTPELQRKRKNMLKSGVVQDGALAESLLGVLYVHQMISKPLYEAGRFFGELGYRYESCLDHTFRQQISPLNPIMGRGLGDSYFMEQREMKQTQAWRKAVETLKKVGTRPYREVMKVVFYSQDLYDGSLHQGLLKGIHPLKQGLQSLDDYFRGVSKGNPSSPCVLALNLSKSTTFQPPSTVCQLGYLPECPGQEDLHL